MPSAELEIATEGNCDIIDISSAVEQAVRTSEVESGIVVVSVAHSTAAITTIEYEPGCLHDLKELFEQLVPTHGDYHHNRLAGDSNAHAHLRAALVGGSETLPVREGRTVHGTWQQLVLIDFDDRPRKRRVLVQVISD